MALVTLAGTISAADLNTNFSDKSNTLNINNLKGKKEFQYDLEIYDADNTAAKVPFQTLDFTPPDDLELRVVGMFMNSASAVPTLTLTISAIDIAEVSVSDYLLNQSIVLTKQAVVGQTDATRDSRLADSATKIFLKKGITYRMRVTSNSATVVDYVQCFMYCRTRRRRS
jgi:hypothetical protein